MLQPTPPAEVNLLYALDYVDEANFEVNAETDVAADVFECAVEASQHRRRHRRALQGSVGLVRHTRGFVVRVDRGEAGSS